MTRSPRARVAAVIVISVTALAVVVVGGAAGRRPGAPTARSANVATGPGVAGPGVASSDAATPAAATPASRLDQAIAQAQERLRRLPGDWRAWAALSLAYLEHARISSDPTYYARAEQAVTRSLAVHPESNVDALVAAGGLANARHDFARARTLARSAVAADPYSADAFAVLTDAQTQLGNGPAATDAVQRLLDLRPGLAAYARASYDLELRGHAAQAADLMRRALTDAVDPSDIAFCRSQLGDLELATGNLTGARVDYRAGLAADPGSVAARRGLARVDGAEGRTAEAVAGYAALTERAPTPTYLLEYADLLEVAGRGAEAGAQRRLAAAAHQLFTDSGGIDGLTGAALAEATDDPAGALTQARAEWARRHHPDVADGLAWALHLTGADREASTYVHIALSTGARPVGYVYHLAMIELSLGDRAAARSHLSEALRNPSFSPVAAADARRTLAALES